MGFKPYYNWNTFNTYVGYNIFKTAVQGFKPYYNWNTFNTAWSEIADFIVAMVLNLIITGIPSIHNYFNVNDEEVSCFKPYYNWNTFNT